MHFSKLILLVLLALSFSCAKIVMPTGGPTDQLAPEVLKSNPQNRTVNFNSDKITIDFDEFIVLKGFNEEFVSSPPFSENPKKMLQNKSLILKIEKDSLIPNSTYTLDFGNSILDFRAGNVLNNYQYIFSTGDFIDSLYISGFLKFAEDLTPEEKVWVMLYKDYNDTVLKTRKPDFIAKTNKEGFYAINNIGPGTYGIAALKDINNNLIFDLPNEQIAFLDSVFNLKSELIPPTKTDSIWAPNTDKDSINDTLIIDSLVPKPTFKVYPELIDLFLFEEQFSNIYIVDKKRTEPYLLSIIFSEPYDSSLSIAIPDVDPSNWILEPNLTKDTFSIWLIDSGLAKNDSLTLILDYFKTDSTKVLSRSIDTLAFKFTEKTRPKPRQSKKTDTLEAVAKPLYLTSNFAKSTINFFETPQLKAGFPVKNFDASKIHLYLKKDTTYIEQKIPLYRDSINTRIFKFSRLLMDNSEFKILVEPGAFEDYRGLKNDTLEQTFKTSSAEKYTTLIIDIQGTNQQQVIVQLFNSSNKFIEQRVINKDQKVTFEHLNPSSFTLKLIEDKNKNGRWDTGNFELKTQPETVRFFKEKIVTKANWSHDIIWNLKD